MWAFKYVKKCFEAGQIACIGPVFVEFQDEEGSAAHDFFRIG
jgi:hypothetical protein